MCASCRWYLAFCDQKIGLKFMNLLMRRILMLLIVATLAACAANRPAPVSEARSPAVPKSAEAEIKASPQLPEAPKPVDAGKLYTIQKGDTLISIALANGLDYREFAAWNNIVNPNLIKLGEVLRLTPPGSTADGSANSQTVQTQSGAVVSSPLRRAKAASQR